MTLLVEVFKTYNKMPSQLSLLNAFNLEDFEVLADKDD